MIQKDNRLYVTLGPQHLTMLLALEAENRDTLDPDVFPKIGSR